MGEILRAIYELQLDDVVTTLEDAKARARITACGLARFAGGCRFAPLDRPTPGTLHRHHLGTWHLAPWHLV